MYKPECPIPLRPGFYQSFRVDNPEEARQALMDSWSTPEQQIFNLMHQQCPKCRGHGYAVYRSKGTLVRERVGCDRCLGIGVIQRSTHTSNGSVTAQSGGGDGKVA